MFNDKIIENKNVSSGRDVNNYNNSGSVNVYSVLPSPLSEKFANLMQALAKDRENNQGSEEILESLQHYMVQHGRHTRDLAQKLTDAGFGIDAIENAKDCKELIAKLIIQLKHFKSGQELISALLVDAEFKYSQSKIKLKELPEKTYNALVSFLCEVINETFEELQRYNEVILRRDHYLGLLFYLAGHCHIDFDV